MTIAVDLGRKATKQTNKQMCRKVVILLAFYVIVSRVALMQEVCDIIGLLYYCVRSGSYAGRL